MPDFEALIRYQQLKKSTTNQRLKVVEPPDLQESDEETIIAQSGFFVNFFGGFIGSIIGTLIILFLYINEYLPIDLIKLQ